MSKEFSIRRAIAAQIAERAQEESEHKVLEQSKQIQKEAHRSINSNYQNKPGMYIPLELRKVLTAQDNPIIQTERGETIFPLDGSVLKQAGARFLTGLKGDFTYPTHTGVQAYWGDEETHAPEVGPNLNWYLWDSLKHDYVDSGVEAVEELEDPFMDAKGYWNIPTEDGTVATEIKGRGENDRAKDAAGEFKKGVKLTPKRLTAFLTVSKQLLLQTSGEVETTLRELIAQAVLTKLEQTVFSFLPGNNNRPSGLFVGAESLGAISWDNIVSMEDGLANADAIKGNVAYITHPKLLTKAKTTLKDVSGGGGFIAKGMMNDYPAIRTTNMCKELGVAGDEYGIIFGNWNDLVIGQWGTIEIIANPYTLAREGEVQLVLNSYWDFKTIRNESFAIGSMK